MSLESLKHILEKNLTLHLQVFRHGVKLLFIFLY